MRNEKRTAPKGDSPALSYILANEKTAVNLRAGKDIGVIFHPISQPPKVAGEYNLLHRNGWTTVHDYTVDGGWNTWFDEEMGEIYAERAEDPDQYGWIAWAELVPGCRKEAER